MIPILPSEWRSSCRVSVSSSRSGRDVTIVVAGEADWTTADLLHDQLVEAFGPRVERIVLELGGLTFCNLRGLRALHESVEVARRSGIDVTMHGMSRQLGWLYSNFLARLSPTRGLELAGSGRLRGSRTVDATALEHPWESSDTA